MKKVKKNPTRVSFSYMLLDGLMHTIRKVSYPNGRITKSLVDFKTRIPYEMIYDSENPELNKESH